MRHFYIKKSNIFVYKLHSKALKRFREVDFEVDPAFIKKIEEEVELVKKINNKNIIKYINRI